MVGNASAHVWHRPVVAALLVLVLAAACAAPRRGTTHVVRSGENLYRIGKAYGVPYPELARLNGISDPSKIVVGQKIFIPGGERSLPVEIITPESTELDPASSPGWLPPLPDGRRPFAWPTRFGSLSSGFGSRNGTVHDGIDIAAPEGTVIYAAGDGRVIYSDRIPGYGNIVILDHGRGLTTVYAHNSRNDVREGDEVKQGQEIARLGQTGRTTGPNLHFEVRQGNVARNPLSYLPALGQ